MPRVFRIELPEAQQGTGWAWPSDLQRWADAFRAAWFADFRARWQRDLRDARLRGPLTRFVATNAEMNTESRAQV